MLNQLAASTIRILADGSITGKDSPLVNPAVKKGYSHHQIVWGLTFDVTVTLILVSIVLYTVYKNFIRPNRAAATT